MSDYDEEDVMMNSQITNNNSSVNTLSFDPNNMRALLEEYKKQFKVQIWEEEKYKWQAIKIFQDNWDIDAENLSDMIDKALSGTSNLLTSSRRYAKGMLVEYARLFPNEVRAMFINLYDENIDIYERISNFRTKSDELLPRWAKIWDKPDNRSHFQDINAISTYLWLRYPDKYYIFKYSIIKSVIDKLNSSYTFKKGANAANVRSFLKLYDEMRSELRKDPEISKILQETITPDCYPDPSLNTLTIDFGFFIGWKYSAKSKSNDTEDEDEYDESDPYLFSEEWLPQISEYDPAISKDKWLSVLNKLIGPIWGGLLAAFYDEGGAATCSQIASKYNKNVSGISGTCTQLAKRIHKETKCPLSIQDNGKKRYWPILFQSKVAGSSAPGAYIWKLRPELYEALTEFDIMKYQWEIPDNSNVSYWWLNANPKIWSFSNLAVNECVDYELYNENGNKRHIFKNFLDAKAGDKVIGYESTPRKQIVALAEVARAQDGETILFRKTESLEYPIDYQVLKECDELSGMEFFANPNGSLFKLTEEEYNIIMDLIRDFNPSEKKDTLDKYDESAFLKDVFMTKERYSDLVSILKTKKNIILQGAPGVGKTFAAKRLAYSIMGEKDENRIEFIQFHQNYSYEDFVMGYKPTDTGFELKNGIFYRFCQKASNKPEVPFFFIIDEINRGNMSKIFGELLMLIEKDYRGTKATLAYNGMAFSVPDNLYIIGMMNTADRSLAMIDYALRRRFSFFEMSPGFETEGFINYQNKIGNDTFDELISRICDLNKEITADKALGKGFCIGHSYFCNIDNCNEEQLESIVKYEIIPMLEEYWFDDETKLKRWSNTLLGIFNEQ